MGQQDSSVRWKKRELVSRRSRDICGRNIISKKEQRFSALTETGNRSMIGIAKPNPDRMSTGKPA